MLDGGHFFVTERRVPLLALVRDALRPWFGSRP
jgi:surfactin synthase thioesterase subunit